MCAERAFMGTEVMPVSVWSSPVSGSEQTSQNTVLFRFKIVSPCLEILDSPMMLAHRPAFAGRDFCL